MIKKSITFIAVFSLMSHFLIASKSKVAFVTGGSTGIGAATIELFIKQGIKVGFLDKKATEGLQLVNRFSPDDILFVQGDVSKTVDIQNAINATVTKFGHLDIVFANAGI